MLTNYFSFDIPNTQEAVYATSDKFALNSQAALSFYNEDQTVRDTYKRLYLIGRDKPRNVTRHDAQSVTGGDAHRNLAHPRQRGGIAQDTLGIFYLIQYGHILKFSN